MIKDIFKILSESIWMTDAGSTAFVVLGVGFGLGLAVFFGLGRFVRLWNKVFQFSGIHYVIAGLAALFVALAAPTLYALWAVAPHYCNRIETWGQQLQSNTNWQSQVFAEARTELSRKHASKFIATSGEAIPNAEIPGDLQAARTALANSFFQATSQSFEQEFPHTNWVLHPESDSSKEDLGHALTPTQSSLEDVVLHPMMTLSSANEMQRRLDEAGAQSGAIQVSLSWDNFNDLDLHCQDPKGETIWFGHERSNSGGHLDVDENHLQKNMSQQPVENIFWSREDALPGTYKVYVEYFSKKDKNHDENPFRVRVKLNGKAQLFEGKLEKVKDKVLVTEFEYQKGDFHLYAPYNIQPFIQQMIQSRQHEACQHADALVLYSRLGFGLFFLVLIGLPAGVLAYLANRALKPSI